MPTQPTIVCLCGSTRFSDAFQKANFDETLAGRIVLTIGCDMRSDEAHGLTSQDKQRLDELHKRKIDLADEILVLNVGGYVGVSTASEIGYARAHDKHIRWLEPPRVQPRLRRENADRRCHTSRIVPPGGENESGRW